MFELYTEKARRTIFFARYEASQFGSPTIEAEHLLLGLMREDRSLTMRILHHSRGSAESIRKEIERHSIRREKVSTAVDLPLSNECKHVLAYAAEESERLGHRNIGAEHLLLGLLREQRSFAAQLLRQQGITADEVRKDVRDNQPFSAQPGIGAGPTKLKLLEFEIALKVADLDTSLAFYTKLGFVEVGGNRAQQLIILANGTCRLALYQAQLPENLLSIRGLDVSQIAARLQAAGLIFEKAPFAAPDGSTAAMLRDPDGNAIYLASDPAQGPRS